MTYVNLAPCDNIKKVKLVARQNKVTYMTYQSLLKNNESNIILDSSIDINCVYLFLPLNQHFQY